MSTPDQNYGPWTDWVQKFILTAKLEEWDGGQWYRDRSRKGKQFRGRQVFSPQVSPQVNGQHTDLDEPVVSDHPLTVLVGDIEHEWFTDFAGIPVPQDHDTQVLMWNLHILREDLDPDTKWERRWHFYVRNIAKGNVTAAVEMCAGKRAPGGWRNIFPYVGDVIRQHLEKRGVAVFAKDKQLAEKQLDEWLQEAVTTDDLRSK